MLSAPAEHLVLPGLQAGKKYQKLILGFHQNQMFIVCIQLAVSTDTRLVIKSGNYQVHSIFIALPPKILLNTLEYTFLIFSCSNIFQLSMVCCKTHFSFKTNEQIGS